MAKVYKVDTGLTSPWGEGWLIAFRNAMYNVLNSYFPSVLHTVDNTRYMKSIQGSGNCGITFRSSNTQGIISSLINGGNTNPDDVVYDANNNSGSLCIFHMPIKNGVLIGICGANDDYTKYMNYAFIKDKNDHVIFYNLFNTTYSLVYIDFMANNSIASYDPLPKAAPIIDSSKICMSKMIVGDSIHDIYVASVTPISPVNAQSFIIDDKEYIAATQKKGYCPAVFRVD